MDVRGQPPYLINRFWTVGLADPYPDDEYKLIGSIDDVPSNFYTPCRASDHVYHQSRYKKENSPYCIYMPSKEIMLKIMRACIKVDKPEDLWIMPK